MLIEIKNVSLFFGTTIALHNLSLEVQGGAVGLLGPNGAGKSTLIKTLLGFRQTESRQRYNIWNGCGKRNVGNT